MILYSERPVGGGGQGRESGIDRGDDPELVTYLRIEERRQARRSPGVSSDQVSGTDDGAHDRTRMWRFRRVVHRYVNPITRPVAKKLPTFAILTHRGRKSGRTYRTPINVFRRGDEYFFFLTYGSDVQVKNILATGSCSIETRGWVIELVEPEPITDPEPPARAASRPLRRAADRRVTQYLRMRASSSPDPSDAA